MLRCGSRLDNENWGVCRRCNQGLHNPAVLQFVVLDLALVLCASGAMADDGPNLGFGYCPPPVIPSCIDRAAKTRSKRDFDACSRDVLRFTQSLGTYRTCLTRESERAIGTGNDAIARFRCLTQRGPGCQ